MTDETGSAALTALRSELLLQLGEMRGDIRLILQSIQHQADRAEEHRQSITALDGRVDGLERTTVTRDELEKAVAKVRADAAQQREEDQARADRRVRWVAVILTSVFSGIAIVLTIVGFFVPR